MNGDNDPTYTFPNPARALQARKMASLFDLRNRVIEGSASAEWDALLGHLPASQLPGPRCACGNLLTIDNPIICDQCRRMK
jgi:hypothetical protein